MMHKNIPLKFLLISMLCASYSYADNGGFITIIGPDGLPMIVPHPSNAPNKNVEPPATPAKKTTNLGNLFNFGREKNTASATQQNVANTNGENTKQAVTIQQQMTPTQAEPTQIVSSSPVVVPNKVNVQEKQTAQEKQISQVKPVPYQSVVSTQQTQHNPQPSQQAAKQITQPTTAQQTTTQQVQSPPAVQQLIAQPAIAQPKTTQPKTTQSSTAESSYKSSAPQQTTEAAVPFQLIDGEKYYESEYLESKEFNLDNKKRFYQIPTGAGGMSGGGSSNWEVVEREKGVDMSWFNTSNQENEKPETVVLGTSYKVIAKEQLVQALPMQCVDDKAKRKSKEFKSDNTLALFPRAPFKDDFDYELISLDQSIQNFRIASYANSNKSPTYYWPIVVFLDQQGCIIEGASAFYTRSYPATVLQTGSVEGVIHVPQKSKYVLLSALEEAADLPDLKLSNQGQIKLTVLR